MRSNKVNVQVNKLIVFLGEIAVAWSIQSMELNVRATQPSIRPDRLRKTALWACDWKSTTLQRHSLTWVLYKMYVRTLSLSLSCANRLPFSNNGWDLWEPARDQNSLVHGCTVHHTRTSPKASLRPHQSELNFFNQKPEETRSVSNRRCTSWLHFYFSSASQFCALLTALDKHKLFPQKRLQNENQNEL